MKNLPKHIYINPENEEFGDFFELNNGLVSWSKNRVTEDDLKFLSVDFISRRKLKYNVKNLKYKL